MIEGKNFKILEFQDIVDACNNMKEAGNAIGAKLKAMNVDGKGDQDRAEFLGDLLTVLAAAGVGAAVAKTWAASAGTGLNKWSYWPSRFSRIALISSSRLIPRTPTTCCCGVSTRCFSTMNSFTAVPPLSWLRSLASVPGCPGSEDGPEVRRLRSGEGGSL